MQSHKISHLLQKHIHPSSQIKFLICQINLIISERFSLNTLLHYRINKNNNYTQVPKLVIADASVFPQLQTQKRENNQLQSKLGDTDYI